MQSHLSVDRPSSTVVKKNCHIPPSSKAKDCSLYFIVSLPDAPTINNFSSGLLLLLCVLVACHRRGGDGWWWHFEFRGSVARTRYEPNHKKTRQTSIVENIAHVIIQHPDLSLYVTVFLFQHDSHR